MALAMAMDFLSKSDFNRQPIEVGLRFRLLIREGVAMGAYHDNWHFIHDADLIKKISIDGKGWIHDGLVKLAKRHGFKHSFRREFNVKTRFLDNVAVRPISNIVVLLRRGIPVLVSFKKGRGGHLVLLVGFRYLDVGRPSGLTLSVVRFYYHDPDARSHRSGAFRFISTAQFLKRWKGKIVVVQK